MSVRLFLPMGRVGLAPDFRPLVLMRHGGRTPAGVHARVAQRLLAMAACIWHNWQTGAPELRSLIAYDH